MAGIDRALDSIWNIPGPEVRGGNVFRFADTKGDSSGNGKPDWLDDILNGDDSDDSDDKDDSKKESRRRRLAGDDDGTSDDFHGGSGGDNGGHDDNYWNSQADDYADMGLPTTSDYYVVVDADGNPWTDTEDISAAQHVADELSKSKNMVFLVKDDTGVVYEADPSGGVSDGNSTDQHIQNPGRGDGQHEARRRKNAEAGDVQKQPGQYDSFSDDQLLAFINGSPGASPHGDPDTFDKVNRAKSEYQNRMNQKLSPDRKTTNRRRHADDKDQQAHGMKGDCPQCMGSGDLYAGDKSCPGCGGSGMKGGNKPPSGGGSNFVPPNFQGQGGGDPSHNPYGAPGVEDGPKFNPKNFDPYASPSSFMGEDKESRRRAAEADPYHGKSYDAASGQWVPNVTEPSAPSAGNGSNLNSGGPYDNGVSKGVYQDGSNLGPGNGDNLSNGQVYMGMVHRAHRGQSCERWSHGANAPAAVACIESNGRHLALCASHYKQVVPQEDSRQASAPRQQAPRQAAVNETVSNWSLFL